MASALDAVLQLRGQEEQRQKQAFDMASQLQQFRQQADQQAAAQQMAQLQMAQAQKQQEFTNKTSLADLGIKQADLNIKQKESDINSKLLSQYLTPAVTDKLQPSFSGGKISLKPPTANNTAISPEDLNTTATMMTTLGDNGIPQLVPSMIPGRNGKLQAIAAARKLDPNYNPSEADMNFAVTKMGAGAFEKNFNNLDSFHQDFEKNADYLLKLSSNFDRSLSPIINKALVSGANEIQGNPKATQILQAVNTVANGYARLQNPTLSGQALSDAARDEAQSLINGFQSDVQMKALLDPTEGSMRIDAKNRVDAAQNVRDRIAGKKLPSALQEYINESSSDNTSTNVDKPKISKEAAIAELKRRGIL